MKRIAIIIDYFCLEEQGGIFTYEKELLRELARNKPEDWEITIVGFDLDKLAKKYDFLKNFKILNIPLFRNIPFYFDWRHFFLVPIYLCRNKFDVVVELTQSIPFLFKKYKLVGVVHDLTPLIKPELHKNRRISFWRHKIFLQKAFEKCDKIIAVSQNTKKDIQQFFPMEEEKIVVIPEGVKSLEKKEIRVKEKYKIETDFILSVGTLEPRKNYPVLIKAFDDFLVKTGNNYTLVIIGRRGWKDQAIYETIKKCRYPERIKILENVTDDELAGFYQSSLFFIYLSLYEGFGLPVLEAMSLGKAVITSRNSSLIELEISDKMFVNPQNEEEIIARMDLLINDPILRQQEEKNNKIIATNYSWGKTAKEFIRVINSL